MTLSLFRLSRGRVAVLVCLAVAGYFLYNAGIEEFRSRQAGNERAEAIAELRALEEEKAYLQAVREYAASDAYVEQQARRQLGWVRDGEVPFVVTSPPSEARPENGDWWQRLFPR